MISEEEYKKLVKERKELLIDVLQLLVLVLVFPLLSWLGLTGIVFYGIYLIVAFIVILILQKIKEKI